MRLTREARRRLERKRERELKRMSKSRNLTPKVGATMSLALLIALTSNSVSNAATIDDLRELLGDSREDSRFTEEERRQIISEYSNIERHNALANIINSFDIEPINEDIKKEHQELSKTIDSQKQALVTSFQSGAPAEEVMGLKSLLESLKYSQTKIKQDRQPLTLEELQNNVVKEYEEVLTNIEEVESYEEIGEVGSMLLSPLLDTLQITSPFGYRVHPIHKGYTMHNGVDFQAPVGKPVHTTWQGVVTRTYTTESGGNTIEVTHDDGLQTRYLHLDEILVREGQFVEQYTQIGTVGVTGKVTGAHLHFEVLLGGEYVNPMFFFGGKGAKALDNYIITSEDPIILEMKELVRRIKNNTVGIADELERNFKPIIPGEYREIKYERSGKAPKDSIEVKLPEGYTTPTPSDDIR